jgi:hypothetical protein
VQAVEENQVRAGEPRDIPLGGAVEVGVDARPHQSFHVDTTSSYLSDEVRDHARRGDDANRTAGDGATVRPIAIAAGGEDSENGEQ